MKDMIERYDMTSRYTPQIDKQCTKKQGQPFGDCPCLIERE